MPVCFAAVLVRGLRMFLRLDVTTVLVVVSGLSVVMRCALVMRSSGMMMVAGRMFGHGVSSLSGLIIFSRTRELGLKDQS